MHLNFPPDFIFGTSTAAAQIETAFDHDWQGFQAKDGSIFDRTTDHELRFEEDANIIASLAPGYRMGLMWSKLQRGPFEQLHEETTAEYLAFIKSLRAKGVRIMMVLHHFSNPTWFAQLGGWENRANVAMWVDFAKKVVDTFGDFIESWNTFNEPNVYVSYGWLTGFFPPFRKNPVKAIAALKNMSMAHDNAYDYIKKQRPIQLVGISHNAVLFASENFLGKIAERACDWWFMDYVLSHFEKVDFFGMSYYARMAFDPFPITYMDSPTKIQSRGLSHDDMWEYHPQGLRICIDRYWQKYKKPIIITENGVCDASDSLRTKAISDYTQIVHQAVQDGIDIRGYYWWSAWDNFEWNLGPSKCFGLYACDPTTKNRYPRTSAKVFKEITDRHRNQTGSILEHAHFNSAV